MPGGRRPGAGKPKGYKHASTIRKAADLELFRRRVHEQFEPLITAHLEAAKGAFQLFARTKDDTWVQVTDAATMQRCLDSGSTFYRFEQKAPNPQLLKDVWDRTFGPPAQLHTLQSPSGTPPIIRHIHEVGPARPDHG